MDPRENSIFKMDPNVLNIAEASYRFNVSFITRAKAMLLYHHFMSSTNTENYDKTIVAMASFSLSSKHNEDNIEFPALILVFSEIIRKFTPVLYSDDYKHISMSVTKVEAIMLRMFEHNINHVVAHQYLLFILNELNGFLDSCELKEVASSYAFKLISDFYFCKKCIQYKASTIAIVCFEAALSLSGALHMGSNEGLIDWLKNLEVVSQEDREKILVDIFKIFKVNQSSSA